MATSYSRKTGSTLSGIVPETTAGAYRHALFASSDARCFQGLAMTHNGDQAAEISISHRDRTSQVIGVQPLDSLPPGEHGKTLIHMPADPSYAFSLLDSTEPMGVTQLWGTLAEQTAGWCFDATPMALSVRPDEEPAGMMLSSFIPLEQDDGSMDLALLIHYGDVDTITLTLLNAQGQVLETRFVTASTEAASWIDHPFTDPSSGSFIEVTGSAYHRAAAAFRDRETGQTMAHRVGQTVPNTTSWYMVPELDQLEGRLHIINPNPRPIREISIRSFDDSGEFLETTNLASNLSSNHHLVWQVEGLPPRAAYFGVDTTEACTKTLLLSVPDGDRKPLRVTWPAMGSQERQDPLDPPVHIPDPTLKAILLDLVDGQGGEQDGEVSRQEALGIQELDLRSKQIRDLTGLNAFQNLVELQISSNPLVRTPDLTGLLHLERLECVSCSLTEIPRLPATCPLRILSCGLNHIQVIRFCDSYRHVRILDYSGNPLQILDLSGWPALDAVHLSHNPVPSVSIRDCPSLSYVRIVYNEYLQDMEVVNCPSLPSLTCSDNGLLRLQVKNCPSLRGLQCSWNLLQTLDIQVCPQLFSLYCHWNELQQLDLTDTPNLSSLGCSGNQIEQLTLPDMPHLRSLGCSDNALERLDLPGMPALQELYCADNELTEIILAAEAARGMKILYCQNNQLTDLDPRLGFNNGKNRKIDCRGNRLDEDDCALLLAIRRTVNGGWLEFNPQADGYTLECE